MPRNTRIRRVVGVTVRTALAAGVLVGGAMLLLAPAPTGKAVGRGKFSHSPSAAALHDGYEIKDLSAKGLGYILATLAGSAALLVGCVFLMIWLFTSWDKQDTEGLTVEQTAHISTPAPRLQVDAVADLQHERDRELQALKGYRWLDSAHTQAHIPIDRAMTLVVGHSLDSAP